MSTKEFLVSLGTRKGRMPVLPAGKAVVHSGTALINLSLFDDDLYVWMAVNGDKKRNMRRTTIN